MTADPGKPEPLFDAFEGTDGDWYVSFGQYTVNNEGFTKSNARRLKQRLNSAHQAALDMVRNETIEECAKAIENLEKTEKCIEYTPRDIAAVLRALKEKK